MSTTERNPPDLAERITSGQGYTRASGFRLVKIEPGQCELAVLRHENLTQFGGFFHGGVIAGLADQAAGIAVTSALPKGKIGVTVELKINYLQPADGDELIARAEALQIGGSLGVAKIEVFTTNAKSERRCAFATATMRAVDLPKPFS
jgi:uncharacterized protein (TIGR00369 family)